MTKGLLMQTQAKSIEQTIAAIHALDLDAIKFKLVNTEEGQGWSRQYADHNELEYKRFLILLAKYPEAPITPSKSVDKFWHGHILDTLKYAEDCQSTFGYFLHHFPYFGMRGEEDAVNFNEAVKLTNLLYEQEFGLSADGEAAAYRAKSAEAMTAAYCARGAEVTTAAYCAKGAEVTAAAYCARGDEVTTAAYCARGTEVTTAAYCARGTEVTTAAYCAATSKRDKVNSSLRPTLSAAT